GRADREERDHSARLHAAADADRARSARGRHPRGGARAASPDSDDDVVHPVRLAPPRPRNRGGERAATTARPRRDRRPPASPPLPPFRGPAAVNPNPGPALYPPETS